MHSVLIVEDEMMVAMDLEDILSGAGYEIAGIVDTHDAVRRLDHDPAVALVDVNLRDGPTGPEIARTLTMSRGTQVIFVTANPAQIAEPPVGAVGYVQKPFSPQAILGAVRFALTGNGEDAPHGLHVFGPSTA